jgi:flagellar biosynthesis protein FlhB
MADSSKTEKPTSRRLTDARKKGQVARSRLFGEVGGLMAALAVLSMFGARLIDGLEVELTRGLLRIGTGAAHVINAGEVNGLAISAGRSLLLLVGPVAFAAAAAVVALQVAQTGWLISTEALTLNFGRLNPATGFKQFGVSRGGFETVKGLIVITVLVWIAWGVVAPVVADGPRLSRIPPDDAAIVGWYAIRRLLWKSSIALAVLATADYAYQRRQHMNSLKMTKQEVKDDVRMTDGNPETKSRVRKVMQEMFRRRMMAAVPKATVVITNPTHYAIALEYHRETMSAPVIVAMGKDHLAQRIKAIAREHGVPMAENVALAQALYNTCDLGDTVPPHLFEAVAEVLAYLIRLKQLVL